MSTNGIVKLVGEDGDKIQPYDDSPWDGDSTNSNFKEIKKAYEKDYADGKTETAKAVKATLKHAYTITDLGSIQMHDVQTKETTTTYSYAGEEMIKETERGGVSSELVTIDYSQYISQYVMPMDFLVSLLELTGSCDFIDAICELVAEGEIEIVIAPDESYTISESVTRYADDVTVHGLQKIETKIQKDDGKEITTEDKEEYQEVSVATTLSETAGEGEDWNVEKRETTVTEDVDYKMYVKSVKTWYCAAEYNLDIDLNAKYIAVDENGNEVTNQKNQKFEEDISSLIGKEAEILKDAENYHIWVNKEGAKESKEYATDYEHGLDSSSINDLINNSSNNEDKFRSRILSKVTRDKGFFTQENLAKEDENKSQNSEIEPSGSNNNNNKVKTTTSTVYQYPKVTKIEENKTKVKTLEFTTTITKEVKYSNKATNYTDLTDNFLGLLKNDTGTYVKGAKFNAKGKKVQYPDIYNGKAGVGDLLVNGSDALFQFMESTTSYNRGLVNVMKYILYRYNGEDYGVTSFDNVINWLDKSSFSSVGGSSEECLSKMMASYEGTLLTSDGKKYLILDGYNNDGFHSISTAYGMMLYAEGYNGFAYADSFNKAFKDCNIDTTIEKALGDLIDGHNGPIKTDKVSNNRFPEEYALDKDVVETAHRYVLAERVQVVKDTLDTYNSNTGKNLVLTAEQIDALVDAKWQYASFDCYAFIEAYGKLKDGVKDKNIDSLRTSFLPFYDPNYEASGRPAARWKLFTEGIYTLSDGTTFKASVGASPSAEGIINAAEALVELTKQGGSEQAVYGSSRRATATDYSSSVYVCASFVSEVLYNSTGFKNWSDDVYNIGRGLLKDPQFTLVYYKASSATQSDVGEISSDVNSNANIEEILQPGDVVATYSYEYRYQHVEIYLGDGKYATHGGGSGAWNYPIIASGFFESSSNRNIKYIFRCNK